MVHMLHIAGFHDVLSMCAQTIWHSAGRLQSMLEKQRCDIKQHPSMLPEMYCCEEGQTCSLVLVGTLEGTGRTSLNSCDPRGTSSSGGRCLSGRWQGRHSRACRDSHRLLWW